MSQKTFTFDIFVLPGKTNSAECICLCRHRKQKHRGTKKNYILNSIRKFHLCKSKKNHYYYSKSERNLRTGVSEETNQMKIYTFHFFWSASSFHIPHSRIVSFITYYFQFQCVVCPSISYYF